MSLEFDDKGKIFTDVVSKVAIPALVQTTEHLLSGKMHIRLNERVKDELDRDELFLAMTEVSVLGGDGKALYQAPFLAVRRAQIVWVMPIDETGERNEHGS
jgi:hypothetical protein